MFTKFIEAWKKKRTERNRYTDIKKAQEYVYNHVMRPQYLVTEKPSYHLGSFKPEQYVTRTWFNPDTNIKVIRAHFIRADLVEVIYKNMLVANWVDQTNTNGGLTDLSCSELFTLKLVKGNK